MKDLLQEIAEKIAGPYQTPSEGTHDQAHNMMRMVTAWLMTDPVAGGREVARQMREQLRPSKWKCPLNQPDCKRNCGNYGCGN